jgi:hypothetical protein
VNVRGLGVMAVHEFRIGVRSLFREPAGRSARAYVILRGAAIGLSCTIY